MNAKKVIIFFERHTRVVCSSALFKRTRAKRQVMIAPPHNQQPPRFSPSSRESLPSSPPLPMPDTQSPSHLLSRAGSGGEPKKCYATTTNYRKKRPYTNLHLSLFFDGTKKVLNWFRLNSNYNTRTHTRQKEKVNARVSRADVLQVSLSLSLSLYYRLTTHTLPSTSPPVKQQVVTICRWERKRVDQCHQCTPLH